VRVVTFNANGIRSAAKKGFFDWLRVMQPDFVCIQETKAQCDQLRHDEIFFPASYYCVYADALKKGYSGVAIYARVPPLDVKRVLAFTTADEEGRYLQFDYPGFSIASIYFPSGTSGEERQAIKFQFLDKMASHFDHLKKNHQRLILCGDYNIAHQKIDLKNWQSNQKNSGFLPEERLWLDQLFASQKFVDAFRVFNQMPHEYTWWSNRGRARENNVGWRIDYQIVTACLKDSIQSAHVYRDVFFSDHAPLIVDYQGEWCV
jgi:exodeoxyribonuclease III